MKRLGLALFVLLLAACSPPAPTAIPPTSAPTIDVGAIQTQAAQNVFATQTASIPTDTATPRATNTPAATSTPKPTDTPQATNTPDDFSLIPPRKNYNHTFEVTEEYDNIKGYTAVSLVPKQSDVLLQNHKQAHLFLTYVYDSQSPAIPDVVILQFVSASEDWSYLNCHDINLLIDSTERIAFENEHDGNVLTGFVVEILRGFLTPTQFLRIVNANKVEGKICNDGFILTSEQMEALKDVASRMKP